MYTVTVRSPTAAGGEVGGDAAVAAVAALSCQGGGTQNNIVLYT